MIKPTEITFVEENSSFLRSLWDFLSGSEVKNPHAKAGDTRDVGSVPGLGRYPGGGNGNPLQYSCLRNPKDRDAWQATVHAVPKESHAPEQLNNNLLLNWREEEGC